MRIGLIAPPWVPVPPPAYGGTEAVVDRLARGLVRAGHEVLLAAAANSTCPVPRVAGTDEAGLEAPVCGESVTELRHVIASYPAMRGVDIGTKQEVYEMIREEAANGRTFIWYTTEMDELGQCDHVYVFRNGSIVADLARDELTEQKVLHASFEEAC